MLSSVHKAEILARTGLTVPPRPADTVGQETLLQQWEQQIDNLFATYVAARAARSMREAESQRSLASLRQANNVMTHPVLPDDPHDD